MNSPHEENFTSVVGELAACYGVIVVFPIAEAPCLIVL